MLSVLFLTALPAFFTLFFWKSFRHLFVKCDLDNLPGPPASSFLYGHVGSLFDLQSWTFHRKLAEKYGTVMRLQGIFGRPILYTHDPRAIHNITVKDYEIFENPEWLMRVNTHIFGFGLFTSSGEQHRKQRKMLNPAFSSAHMRNMTPLFYGVAHRLREAIKARVRERAAEIDMVGWMGRTALELVGQAGLGHSFDPLVEDKTDAFAEALKNIVPMVGTLGSYLHLLPLCEAVIPERWLRPVMRLVPIEGVRRLMDIADTMRKGSSEIFAQKKKALLQGDDAMKQQVGEGRDVISILLKANMMASEEDRILDDELISHMSMITFAAMDTTSNALSLTLWLLAQHPDAQDKLRKEIMDAQHARGGQDIEYDDLVSLPYLDAVCRETLRLHAPAPVRFRETRRDVVVPLSESVRGLDGREMHDILVPRGTAVFVSVSASNTNPAIWGPDAHEWKPERWLSPLPDTVQDARIPGVYSNLMTFWAGSRSCIGFKFSQLEMKVVLAVMLSTFTFELTEKPIYWNHADIIYPTLVKSGNKPEMPLRVGRVKP